LPAALVILMNTWFCGGGAGLADFFPHLGMGTDSTSECRGTSRVHGRH
jgi:hypothetical protein